MDHKLREDFRFDAGVLTLVPLEPCIIHLHPEIEFLFHQLMIHLFLVRDDTHRA